MKKLILMQGLPGSGKSSYADKLVLEQGFQVVCSDNIRYALGIGHNGDNWSETKENLVRAVRAAMVEAHMRRGLPIIVDDTHTKPSSVLPFVELARQFDYTVEIHRVETPVNECMARRCPGGFPKHVIERLAWNLRNWPEDAPAELGRMLPEIVIVRNGEGGAA